MVATLVPCGSVGQNRNVQKAVSSIFQCPLSSPISLNTARFFPNGRTNPVRSPAREQGSFPAPASCSFAPPSGLPGGCLRLTGSPNLGTGS